MNEVKKNEGEVLGNDQRERKLKKKEVYRVDKKQRRFYIDFKGEDGAHKRLMELLTVVNEKDYGSPIGVKEVFIHSMGKLNPKDLEKIRDSSLSGLEKVERARIEFNEKNDTNFKMEEFLLRRLNLI